MGAHQSGEQARHMPGEGHDGHSLQMEAGRRKVLGRRHLHEEERRMLKVHRTLHEQGVGRHGPMEEVRLQSSVRNGSLWYPTGVARRIW